MLTQANTAPVVSLPMGMDANENSPEIPEVIGLSHSDPAYRGSPHLDAAKPRETSKGVTNEAQPLMVKNAVQKHVERLLTAISESELATGDTLAHAHDAHVALMKMLSSLEAEQRH